MADPLLIIRENSTGLDARLVESHKKTPVVQVLARVAYEDLETGSFEPDAPQGVAEEQTRLDAGLSRVVQAIDPAIQKQGPVPVILLLPAGRFYFRHISLPFTSRSKIRQVLPLELAARFPKEPGNMVTDFFQYDMNTRQSTSLIFSGSIGEQTLKSCHASLTGAGLKPAAVTPAPVAMAAAFLEQNKEKTDFIFLDMDGCEQNLTLVARTHIVQIRTLSADASPGQADQTIRQMLLGFWQRFGVTIPFDIYVCGQLDESTRNGWHHALCDTLKFQADFMGRDSTEPDLAEPPAEPVFVDPAQNLAGMSPDLDMLNMCQGEYGSDSFLQAWSGYIISCCALALIAFILVVLNIHMDISRLENQVDLKTEAMADIYKKTFPGKKIGNIDPLLLMQADAQELSRGGSANAGAENLSRVQAGNVLLELSSCIPLNVDVQVDRLMLDKDRMILSGSADNYNTIDQVKGFIEKSPFFKKVDIGSAVAGKRGNRVDFKFIIET